MSKYLKALGLAMLAAFALSAVAATTASAKEKRFHSHETNTTLTGTPVAGEQPHFEIHEKGKTTCEEELYEGTTNAKTVKEVTITPTYGNCKTSSSLGNLTTHVEMNGCAYTFTLENVTTKTPDESIHTQGPVHIECPKEKEITIRQTAFGFTACLIHIPAQTPTKPTVDYKNEGNTDEKTTDIKVTATVEGIWYTTTTGLGGESCPAHEAHDATFTGAVTVKGFEDTGEPHKHNNVQVPIWVGTIE